MLRLRWWRELRRRWPALVGILRGKTVIYAAHLGPPEVAMVTCDNRNGAVIMDTLIEGRMG